MDNTHYRCNACGSTYWRVQHDGTLYFHACAPLSDAEVRAQLGLDDDITEWTPAQRQAFADASRVRPHHRDENLKALTGKNAGVMIAEGAGVTVL